MGSPMENQNRYTITLDDDPTVCKFIARATGINSLPFTSGAALLKRSASYDPVAVFVDVHLGVADCGLDVIPHLRKCWRHVPIIVITSDPTDDLVGNALATGADDFVRKPINVSELKGRLHARIAEMFTRKNVDVLSVGDLTFCHSLGSLESQGKIAYLPKLELHLFATLLQNRNMLVSRDELKRRLWGRIKVSDNALDKKISRIRQALADVGSQVTIQSLYGQGIVVNATKPEANAA